MALAAPLLLELSASTPTSSSSARASNRNGGGGSLHVAHRNVRPIFLACRNNPHAFRLMGVKGVFWFGIGFGVCGERFLLRGADGQQTSTSAPSQLGQTMRYPFTAFLIQVLYNVLTNSRRYPNKSKFHNAQTARTNILPQHQTQTPHSPPSIGTLEGCCGTQGR